MHQLSWRGCGSTLVECLLTIMLIYNTAVDNRQVVEWRSGYGVGFRTKGSLVRTPACAHFVEALSKPH